MDRLPLEDAHDDEKGRGVEKGAEGPAVEEPFGKDVAPVEAIRMRG